MHFHDYKQSNLCITLNFISSLQIQLINATRFRTFDSVLSGILDGLPAPPSSLSPLQNSNNHNKNTNNSNNTNSKYSNTNNNNSSYCNQTHNQNQNQNQNTAVEDSNITNRNILLHDVKNKLSQWYVQQHGIHTDGNAHEMAAIIQVSCNFLFFNANTSRLHCCRRVMFFYPLNCIILLSAKLWTTLWFHVNYTSSLYSCFLQLCLFLFFICFFVSWHYSYLILPH